MPSGRNEINFAQRREIFIRLQDADEEDRIKEEAPPKQLAFEFMCMGMHHFTLDKTGRLTECRRCGKKL